MLAQYYDGAAWKNIHDLVDGTAVGGAPYAQTGTVTFTLTSAQAPVNLNAFYVGTPVGGVGTVGTAQTAALVASTSTAAALPVTGSLTTGVNHQYVIKAIVEANAATAGTFKLRATESAGTITPLRGSYYKVTRLAAGNVGTFA
jgi:hypothetical protein